MNHHLSLCERRALTSVASGLRALCLLFLCLACSFAQPSLFAQAADGGTGTITGRVLNGQTGRYLVNARVAVPGTNLETYTNDYGEYTLRNVPAGEASLRVSYTGQDAETLNVRVAPGETVTQSITFGRASEDGAIVLNEYVIQENRFRNAQELAINEERYSVNFKHVVAADAFGDFPSGNIGEFVKYLPGVEIDYGGTYTSPADASGVSVRGFGPSDTIIYIDGVPVSSASPASLSNATGLDMLSINNASRVELIKVPTPDMRMEAIGGQINLISKSAFEYAKPTFMWSVYTTVNTEYLDKAFQKVPGPTDKKVLSTMPGFDLSYIKPINDKLGITITLASYNEFTANRRLVSEYRAEHDNNQTNNVDLRAFGGAQRDVVTNAQGTVTLENPFLNRIQVLDSPRYSHRNSGSIKGDWKPFPGLRMSGRYSYSSYESADATRRLQIRARRPMDWGPDYTISYPFLTSAQATAMGREAGTITGTQTLGSFNPGNSFDMDVDSRDKVGFTHSGLFDLEYAKGPWNIKGLAGASYSRGKYKDFENDHFSKIEMSSTVGQVKFEQVADGYPGSVSVSDRDGNPFGWSDLSNWNVNNFKAYSGQAYSSDEIYDYRIDIRRELDFLPFDWVTLGFKTGFERLEETQKKWGVGTGYRESYNGPALSLNDYADDVYTNISPGFGFPAQQWPSTYKLFDFYQANASQFSITDNDAAENWNSYVGQNKRITTTDDQWYAMIDGRALSNRLSFLGGFRDGQKKREGFGPRFDDKWNYLKNPDGTLYRNQTLLGGNGTVRIDQTGSKLFASDTIGQALRADILAKGVAVPADANGDGRPEYVVTGGTLVGAKLRRHPLHPVSGRSAGDPNFMIGAKYEITPKLVAGVNWSRKVTRVELEDGANGILSGNGAFSFNENEDPSASPRGTIKVANPNLEPAVSNDWDFDLAYYNESGGKFGVGYFTKNTDNFQETFGARSGSAFFNDVLTSIGENPADYDDWVIETKMNVPGVTKTYGYELDVKQDLRILGFLGDWGRRTQVFGNYSTKQRKNPAAAIDAIGYSEDTAAAGINIATNRISFLLRGTWLDYKTNGKKDRVTYNGESYVLTQFNPPEVRLDANFNWRFAQRYSFFISARDILNEGRKVERFVRENPELYPGYAHTMDRREFGVNITFGIKGTF